MVRPLRWPACFDPLTPAFAGCAVSVIWSPRFPLGGAGVAPSMVPRTTDISVWGRGGAPGAQLPHYAPGGLWLSRGYGVWLRSLGLDTGSLALARLDHRYVGDV